MLKITYALAGAVMLGATIWLSTIAWAACPPGTRYNCTQGQGGKVICGCV